MAFPMMAMTVTLATVLGSAMALPQAHKAWRTRELAGVSLTWVALSWCLNLAWATYGIITGQLAIVPVSALSMLCYTWIGHSALKYGTGLSRAHIGRALSAGVVPLLIAGGLAVVDNLHGVGIFLGAMYGVQLLPAVFAAYRMADLSGVSPTTWVLGLLEAALWGVYGWHVLDVGILVLAGSGTVMTTLVLARVIWWQLRRRRVRLRTPAYAMA